MAWADMCGSVLTKGVNVPANELYGLQADAARLTRAGLPAAATLARMVAKVQSLKLRPTYKGIAFHIVTCAENRNGLETVQLDNTVVAGKPGARVCFEDKLLPLQSARGVTILVHQGLVPCERCRTGYKAWAQERQCAIILFADEGYDQIPGNTLFVFTRAGDVFYG